MQAPASSLDRRPQAPRLVLLLDLCALFLWPLLQPPEAAALAVGLGLIALNVLAFRRPPGWLVSLERRFRGSERAQRAALVVGSLAVLGGGLEYLAGGLSRLGLVEPYSAMRTMLPAGVEDWRMAHLTADRHRRPDPELLWRPVDRAPYNRQRFKGPIVEVPKPAGVFRIFCYGDSNTDGPPRGGWTERLGEQLAARPGGGRYEVVNAGVTGYSSYQGRLRFARDAPRFEPDLVLVSFGWNDLAPALGAPDRAFQPPPAPLVALQRRLLRYDFFLVARRYWPRRGPPPRVVGPRVSLADYEANLETFIELAARHGGRVVLLTRPHREPESALAARADNWRRNVPAYNRAVRRVAGTGGSILVDAQRRFAGRPELFVDECHFTARGHQRMAAVLERQLSARGMLDGP